MHGHYEIQEKLFKRKANQSDDFFYNPFLFLPVINKLSFLSLSFLLPADIISIALADLHVFMQCCNYGVKYLHLGFTFKTPLRVNHTYSPFKGHERGCQYTRYMMY